MSTLSLREQADAVELVLVNRRGHVDNLVQLVEKRKRPQHELDLARRPLPGLEAAITTLRFLENHETEVRALIKKGKRP